MPTHPPCICLFVTAEQRQVQLGRKQDSTEGLSSTDVRRTTLASVCSVCSGKRMIGSESAQLPLSGPLMADTHCLIVDWVRICNGMCCLIFRPLTVSLGIACCFSISSPNFTSTMENKHTVYSLLNGNCKCKYGHR